MMEEVLLEKKDCSVLLLGAKDPGIQIIIDSLQDKSNICFATYPDSKFRQKYIDNNKVILIDENKVEDKITKSIFDYALLFLENEESRRIILKLLLKLEKDRTKILVIINIRELENYLDFITSNFSEKICFLLSGDIFGENVEESASLVSKITQNVKATNTITMTGDDLSKVYPISAIDFAKGVHKVLFGSFYKQNIFYLFYQHPQTLISMFHCIKKIKPELEIKYKENIKDVKTGKTLDTMEKNFFSKIKVLPSYIDSDFLGFEKSAKKILYDTVDSNRVYKDTQNNIRINLKDLYKKSIFPRRGVSSGKQSKDKFQTTEDGKNYSGKISFIQNKYLLVLSSFVISMLLSLAIILSSFAISVLSLGQSLVSLSNLDFESASKQAKVSSIFASFSDFPVSMLINNIPGLKFRFLKDFRLFQGVSLIVSLTSQDLLGLKAMAVKNDFNKINESIGDFKYVYFITQKIILENDGLKSKYQDFNKLINPDYLSLMDLVPDLAGFGKDKNYLLLFQNNAELRPSGGFIGSVAELSLSEGRVKNFQIRDVYELDGQLKAHIEPNYIIRKNLKQDLFLRDSNFFLDFEDSASSAAFIYNLETNKKLDGIIAVNYDVLKQIIKILGEVNLAEYKTKLTEANALDFIQNTIESNFFPGSNQKKNLLQTLYNQISIQLFDNQANLINVIKLIPGMVQRKQIQIALGQENLETLFRKFNFSGSINDTRIRDNFTVYDSLSVNEANIGINKANMGITRQVDYEIFLDEVNIRSKLAINLMNNNQKISDYKAYLRILTPGKSQIKSIKIDGIDQKIIPAIADFRIYESKNFITPIGLQVDTQNYKNYRIFGFEISLSNKKTKKIEVEYTQNSSPELIKNLKYSLFYIKQSGVQDYPFRLTLHLPLDYLLMGNIKFQKSGNAYVVKDNIDKDKQINLEFTRQNILGKIGN